MKKTLLTLVTFFILSTTIVDAKNNTIYVTDNARFMLRSLPVTNSKIIKMLPSGAELTVLKQDKSTGFSHVRTSKNRKGYILTTNTINKPISKWYLDRAIKKLDSMQQEKDLLKEQLSQLQTKKSIPTGSNPTLILENKNLSKKLANLSKTSADATHIKQQRDHLQERFITIERSFEQMKRENQILKDSTQQDWFLYGGFLSLLGVILGILLPKLSRRNRHSSSWNTL